MIRPFSPADRPEWLRMRLLLWEDCSPEEHEREADGILASEIETVFLAGRPEGGLCGFAEVSVRPWVIESDPGPVGHLEGWFVDADSRRQGVGRALVAAAEAWARSRGCRQMASDAELWNDVSHASHRSIGFTETARLVLFRKDIAGPGGQP